MPAGQYAELEMAKNDRDMLSGANLRGILREAPVIPVEGDGGDDFNPGNMDDTVGHGLKNGVDEGYDENALCLEFFFEQGDPNSTTKRWQSRLFDSAGNVVFVFVVGRDSQKPAHDGQRWICHVTGDLRRPGRRGHDPRTFKFPHVYLVELQMEVPSPKVNGEGDRVRLPGDDFGRRNRFGRNGILHTVDHSPRR